MVILIRLSDLQHERELEVVRGALPTPMRMMKRDDISLDDRGEKDNHHHGGSDDQHGDDDDDDDGDDDDDDGDDDSDDHGGSHHSATRPGTPPGTYTSTLGGVPAATTASIGGNPTPTLLATPGSSLHSSATTASIGGNPIPTWLATSAPNPGSSLNSSVTVPTTAPHLDSKVPHKGLSAAAIGGITFACIVLLLLLLSALVGIRRRLRRNRLDQMSNFRNFSLLTGGSKDRDDPSAAVFGAEAPPAAANIADRDNGRVTRMFTPSARTSFDGHDNVLAGAATNHGRPSQAQMHEMSNLPPSRTSNPQTDFGYYGTGTHEPITAAPPLSTLSAGYSRDVKILPPVPSQPPQFQTPQPVTFPAHGIDTDLDAAHASSEEGTDHRALEHTNSIRSREARAAFERSLMSDSQVSLPPPY